MTGPPAPTDGLKRRLLRQFSVELGPLLAFFVAFSAWDLIWATAVYAAATVLAFAVDWGMKRRLPTLPLISGALLLVFAGFTLALDDATFIKIKPTIVNGFYAAALGFGWLLGYRLIERVLGDELRLTEAALRSLTLRTALYLAGLAAANEIVWRTLPVEYWVTFKVFVIIACNIAFAALNLPLVRRNLVRKGHVLEAAAGRRRSTVAILVVRRGETCSVLAFLPTHPDHGPKDRSSPIAGDDGLNFRPDADSLAARTRKGDGSG